MSSDKYNPFDAEIKEALLANRKELFPNHSVRRELIAKGIRYVEEQLMNKSLEPEEVISLQKEMINLQNGEISEKLSATLRGRPEREVQTESSTSAHHIHSQPSRGLRRNLLRKELKQNTIKPKPDKAKVEEEYIFFDELGLNAEDELQLERHLHFSKERFHVKVIGYLKGASILITAPICENGLRLDLQETEKVIIRSFSGKFAFAFESTILGANHHTFAYLHLSIPEKIRRVRVRNFNRIKTKIIASVLNNKLGEGEQISAIISDICENGASLKSKQQLGGIGDALNLAFKLHIHNVEVFLNVHCIIRAIAGGEDSDEIIKSGFVHHGIEFQDLQLNEQILLHCMTYQQMVENPKSIIYTWNLYERIPVFQEIANMLEQERACKMPMPVVKCNNLDVQLIGV